MSPTSCQTAPPRVRRRKDYRASLDEKQSLVSLQSKPAASKRLVPPAPAHKTRLAVHGIIGGSAASKFVIGCIGQRRLSRARHASSASGHHREDGQYRGALRDAAALARARRIAALGPAERRCLARSHVRLRAPGDARLGRHAPPHVRASRCLRLLRSRRTHAHPADRLPRTACFRIRARFVRCSRCRQRPASALVRRRPAARPARFRLSHRTHRTYRTRHTRRTRLPAA